MTTNERAKPFTPCKIPGCEAAVLARGWCRRHYTRWYETGSTELGVRSPRKPPPPVAPTPIDVRFWQKVQKSEEGCWQWIGGSTTLGYGSIWSLEDRRQVMAHRLSWELANDRKLAADEVIDHLCRNPSCVRPDHLEPVTVSENTRRGLAPVKGGAFQRAKTHCPQGHPYSTENTYYYNDGRTRVCRTCAITRTQERRRLARS